MSITLRWSVRYQLRLRSPSLSFLERYSTACESIGVPRLRTLTVLLSLGRCRPGASMNGERCSAAKTFNAKPFKTKSYSRDQTYIRSCLGKKAVGVEYGSNGKPLSDPMQQRSDSIRWRLWFPTIAVIVGCRR
ncbi:hypothetical protein O9929_25175 [Vibrio lentus]|nr:hypothetical protein [Vibrio lentus]